jgi:hypothetical protein
VAYAVVLKQGHGWDGAHTHGSGEYRHVTVLPHAHSTPTEQEHGTIALTYYFTPPKEKTSKPTYSIEKVNYLLKNDQVSYRGRLWPGAAAKILY